ncbi:methyltransferase domain-containing protein [Thermodesulfobacteriota bacterium]
MKSTRFKLHRFILVLLIVFLLFGIGLNRLKIDTDIVALLPQDDPIISDALSIFRNHPIQDQMIIDVGHQMDDLDQLVDYGALIEKKLEESGLFKTVGMEDVQKRIPDLMSSIVNNLPVMFTEKQLNEKIMPLLKPEAIQKRLNEFYFKLNNLESIGQTRFITRDPLGLKDFVLARLAPLAPSQNARIYRGKLISSDNQHLLVIANPIFSSTDTHYSRLVVELISRIADDLNQEAVESEDRITLTPVGAYRAALDNELIIRRDVTVAVLFATLGIAMLLILAFPRPYMGLLSLLPAIAGSMTAFFVFSLLHQSISIMVLGFGGAIISITVDHGIVYLLFLDRPHRTHGKDASREVWSLGLLAALTTIAAFGALCLSGFPMFAQLGLFTALGIALSFLFVHTVFPFIFPEMPPARSRILPLQTVVDRLALTGKKGAYIALGLTVVMLFFAKPEFNVDLSSMNTVSRDTLAAEKLVADVWGHSFNKVFVMVSGNSIRDLQQKGDHLLERMDQDLPAGTSASGFVPAMVFPGENRSHQNLRAWKKFWNTNRIAALKITMQRVSGELGFKADAFEPFYKHLFQSSAQSEGMKIPEELYSLLGITKSSDGSTWVQVSTLTMDASYDSEKFYTAFYSLGKIFDPVLFSQRLGELLFSSFLRMILIIGVTVFILLFLFFVDLKLTVVSLLPVLFAFICTLGTLNLIGHPLNIAGLMLAIIVIGMGIDYSLFFVRSYQSYGDASHPSFGLIRLAVFMASASTIIGFGVLLTAEHTLLRSAGITLVFGIGYAFIGAFVILPPVLKEMFQNPQDNIRKEGNPHDTVIRHYRHMEAYPRLFARFKMLLDPMFTELPSLLEPYQGIRKIIDVGCGYGVPACWLLERFPESTVYGIDPDPKRVRVAARAVGIRGSINTGRAPDIGEISDQADMALMLDIMHYLNDNELNLTLRRLYDGLHQESTLIVRATILPELKPSWGWRLENFKLKISRTKCYYRTLEEIVTMIVQAGFKIDHRVPSGSAGELFWFIAKTR